MKRILAFLIATSLAASAIAAAPKPLQIFILAGQSNMQGHAKVSTFEHSGIGEGLAGAMAELKQLKRTN